MMYSNFRLKTNTQTWGVYALLLMGFLASSCSAKLAPKYDQAIYDNLTSISNNSMELLSSVPSTDPFTKREDKYNSVIGSLEALKILINARPVPSNKLIDKLNKKVNELLSKRYGTNFTLISGESPSVNAVDQILKNIISMRDSDKKTMLMQGAVDAYKGNITLYLDQAITYESFLKR